MRHVVTFVALLLAACAHAPPPPTPEGDIAGVRAGTAAWVEAYNSRDPTKIAAQYAPDAVFWGTTSRSIRTTPAEVLDYFKDAARRPEARVRVSDQHTRVWGDVGVNTGTYYFSDLRDRERTERPARFTMVFHRREGRWVLVDHHSSETK